MLENFASLRTPPTARMSTPAPLRATFGKHERLCSRTVLQRLQREGRSVNEAPFRLLGMITHLDTASPAQVAFAVPKRHMPHAVDRNLMRRRMREAYRRNKQAYYERLRAKDMQCAWLFVFGSRVDLPFAEVERKMISALERWFKAHG
ncbi:MAG: ribonuclease P protein component [Flavobacteriales bacterium]|nr:ribonuclease P protein component [Flavobacteriales bacterium]